MDTIYVFLSNEGTEVWAPVDAEHVMGNVYRILDCRGEDSAVQFGTGTLVKCREQSLSEGPQLVAYEAAE